MNNTVVAVLVKAWQHDTSLSVSKLNEAYICGRHMFIANRASHKNSVFQTNAYNKFKKMISNQAFNSAALLTPYLQVIRAYLPNET